MAKFRRTELCIGLFCKSRTNFKSLLDYCERRWRSTTMDEIITTYIDNSNLYLKEICIEWGEHARNYSRNAMGIARVECVKPNLIVTSVFNIQIFTLPISSNYLFVSQKLSSAHPNGVRGSDPIRSSTRPTLHIPIKSQSTIWLISHFWWHLEDLVLS